MTAPAIDVRSVVKRYGAFEALRGVSLAIEQGEFFGLLGPNGAGKTSLISIVAGLSRATSGKVEVMGHDVVDDFRAARHALGVVPQELVFDPFFTVRETRSARATTASTATTTGSTRSSRTSTCARRPGRTCARCPAA